MTIETTAIPPSALVEAARHIGQLFPTGALAPDEAIELRTFLHGIPAERAFHTATAVAVRDALRCSDLGHDVFVGVAPRRCPDAATMRTCRHRIKGDKRHVGRIGWAFCEIDTAKGEYQTTDEILDRLDSLNIPPHLVVASGSGGAHAYWRLDQPTSDAGRFERLTRALVRTLGHDYAIDVTRILRVAGTRNRKHDPAPLVRVVRWRSLSDD